MGTVRQSALESWNAAAATNPRSPLLVILAALLLVLTPFLPAQALSEHEVKAAFLLNFTKFVEWDEIELDRNAPIAVCIVGDDPFGRLLDEVVEGEVVGGHKITVQRVKSVLEPTCQVAFFGKSQKDVGKALAALPAKVLTVGEGEPFLRDGGMIAFVVENRRVRFDISMAAVRAAGLRLSSRLLAVARSVSR